MFAALVDVVAEVLDDARADGRAGSAHVRPGRSARSRPAGARARRPRR
ncbi:hypothetical protein [uncultured Nocardioides sp.]|nr:hypothetical protein [uncultured Nocardioides sp.]